MTSQRVYNDGEFGIKTFGIVTGCSFILFSIYQPFLIKLCYFINAYSYSIIGDVNYILPFLVILFFIIKQITYKDLLEIALDLTMIASLFCFIFHYCFEFYQSEINGGYLGFTFGNFTQNFSFYMQYDNEYTAFLFIFIASLILVFYLFNKYRRA